MRALLFLAPLILAAGCLPGEAALTGTRWTVVVGDNTVAFPNRSLSFRSDGTAELFGERFFRSRLNGQSALCSAPERAAFWEMMRLGERDGEGRQCLTIEWVNPKSLVLGDEGRRSLEFSLEKQD